MKRDMGDVGQSSILHGKNFKSQSDIRSKKLQIPSRFFALLPNDYKRVALIWVLGCE